MRGYGAPQVVFALECMLDDACAELGLDPLAVRIANVAREGTSIRSIRRYLQRRAP